MQHVNVISHRFLPSLKLGGLVQLESVYSGPVPISLERHARCAVPLSTGTSISSLILACHRSPSLARRNANVNTSRLSGWPAEGRNHDIERGGERLLEDSNSCESPRQTERTKSGNRASRIGHKIARERDAIEGSADLATMHKSSAPYD
jgi:hypothetical protein